MSRQDARDAQAFTDLGAADAVEAAQAERSRFGVPPAALRILTNPYLTLISRFLLGAIFVLSGLTKLGVPDQFSESINGYGMNLPYQLVDIMARGLPPLELGLGIWLLIGLFTRLAAAVSGGL